VRTIRCINKEAGAISVREQGQGTQASIPKIQLLVLGLLVNLFATRVSAQTCIQCPTDAQSGTMGFSLDVFVDRGGPNLTRVNGQTVGSCEILILHANVSYNSVGTDGGVGAGFTGGTGHYSLVRRGAASVAELISDCTPADMGTTLVSVVGAGNSCVPPEGTTMVNTKAMINGNYTLMPTDIAAGALQFEFEYTNGTVLHPNIQNRCADRIRSATQINIFIAPPPTCSITPTTTNIPQGSPATFMFTGSLPSGGPFPNTYCWRKGCPGSGACLSTTATLTISNAQLSDAGCYEITATDSSGCSTTCYGTLNVSPQFTNVLIAGSKLIMSGSGGASNGTYTVLTTTDLSKPPPVWVPLITNQFDASGQFTFTNSINLNESKRFYRLALP